LDVFHTFSTVAEDFKFGLGARGWIWIHPATQVPPVLAMTAEKGARTRIFNGLPADLFGVFAGSKRWFYADLLEYIDRQIFGDEAAVVSWRTFMEALREYIDREAR